MSDVIVWAVLGALALTAQTVLSIRRKPKWTIEDAWIDRNWGKISTGASVFGLVIFATVFILELNGLAPFYSLTVAPPVAFVFFQTLFTDFRIRYAERWVIRIANLASLATAAHILFTYASEIEAVFFAIFFILACSLFFVPSIGDSDARAFQMVVLSLYPLYGIFGLKLAILGMVTLALIVYAALLIYNKNKKDGPITLPMVPLITLPVLFVSTFGFVIPVF